MALPKALLPGVISLCSEWIQAKASSHTMIMKALLELAACAAIAAKVDPIDFRGHAFDAYKTAKSENDSENE